MKTLGRVDHKTSFLDTDAMERQRGITIFTKQAVLGWKDAQITLLDTPGHVDFSGEMERTLQVLDYAVLVISATDGVQGHTRTVWKLLERYSIPTLVFVNKMDLATADAPAVLNQLPANFPLPVWRWHLWSKDRRNWLCWMSRPWRNTYSGEQISSTCLARMFRGAEIFPLCAWFGVEVAGCGTTAGFTESVHAKPEYPEEFGASVYKMAGMHRGHG